MMSIQKHLGIDLGTANTLVYVKGKGIVLREPSVVAVDEQENRVLAVGHNARMMIGKTPGVITAYRPLKDGVIADFEVTANMLHQFFLKTCGTLFLNRPKVIVCVPYGVTGVEKRAFEDSVLEAGAKSVALIEEPIAAAIGAGLRIGGPRGTMVVDIGGGTTEVAVMSLGGLVLASSLRVGGDAIDNAIVNYMKRKYNVLIGNMTAEQLKKSIGSVDPSCDEGAIEIRGRNLISGLPATLSISSAELREAMSEQIMAIVECVKSTLEKTPPELSADIYDSGIRLTGGGAAIRGLDKLLTAATGVNTFVSPKPLDSVINGIGMIIEKGDRFNLLVYRSK